MLCALSTRPACSLHVQEYLTSPSDQLSYNPIMEPKHLWSERRGTQEWQSKAQENHKLDIVQTITSDKICTPGINPYLRSDTGCTHSCELYQKNHTTKKHTWWGYPVLKFFHLYLGNIATSTNTFEMG